MQNTFEQSWLSIDAICTVLRLNRKTVLQLAKKGCLAVIWGPTGNKKISAARFLDPTPEYREQLRLGAILHQHAYPVPSGLSEKSLLTLGECSELLGWKWKRTNKYFHLHALPSVRVNKTLYLYSPAIVRDIMLKRSKRRLSRQKAPFLLGEIVDFFKSRLTEDISSIPTDAEFLADERLQKRLSKIVTEPQKNDFASKVALAKRVVQILESIKSR